MVTATLLPFPLASGADALRRPELPTSGASASDGFADAMHGALDAPRVMRRTDTARAPRRLEPAKPRTADGRASAPSRRAAGSARPAAAKKADAGEAAADDTTTERAGEPANDAVAAADPSETPKAEVKPAGAAVETPAESAAGAAADGVAAQCVAEPDASVALGDSEGDAAEDGPLARGRRWTIPSGGPADEKSGTTPKGTAQHGAAAAGLSLKVGHAVQQARTEAGATPGQALAEIAQQIVASAHGDAAAAGAPATTGAPVPGAVESTAETKKEAMAADAMTALENAESAAEAVASADLAAGAGADGSQTHEQAQPKPEAPGSQSNATPTITVAAPGEGVRFTVTGAAGNAAYTNAAPRNEEAVLPQIVQSIRLHAVQGTTEARVQLRPEHLGVLNITLKVEQNQVTATIQADVAAVRQWIESHESSLRQALSEQGLHLAKLVVHPDGEQTSKDEQGGEQPRRDSRRRSWRDEAATFEVLV